MAMQMPPPSMTSGGVLVPSQPASPGAPTSQGANPFPGQSTPVRRDRTVRAPGTRGGHYRRVWSERKHKFYIKYGDAPDTMRVRSTGGVGAQLTSAMGGDAQFPDAMAANPQTQEAQAREQLFESFYALLREAFQEGPDNSGNQTGGKAVSFGDVSPLTGEIAAKRMNARFLLLDGNGQQIENIRRPIVEEDKQADFFCFLAATYAVNQFLEQQKNGAPLPEATPPDATTTKSLLLTYGNKFPKELKKLSKALRLMAATDATLVTAPPSRRVEPPSGLPLGKIVALQKSLQELHPTQPKKRKLTALQKHLGDAWKTLDRLEKSLPPEETLVKANQLGRLRGVAGGGRSHSAVFRRPGRPPGTSQNLSVASPGMGASTHRPPVKESKEDWQNHKDLHVGARVRVHHPHTHEKPVWGRIVAIGRDGVKIVEDSGKMANIRWPHIHDIMPRLDNNPQNSFEMARYGLPMTNLPMTQKHEMDLADRVLRRLGMPHNNDMIHDGHESRNDAYAHLIESGAPIDPIEATKSKKDGKNPIDSFKGNLIDAAIARKVPVDPELLRKLPFEKVIEVLHHHLNRGHEE